MFTERSSNNIFQLVWKEPDVEGVVAFMCGEKAFEYVYVIVIMVILKKKMNVKLKMNLCRETRIRNSLAKMSKGRQAASQGRIDSFFTTQKVC